MTIPSTVDLSEWFNENIQDFLCLSPTSTSSQPVHALNGFFHNLLTGRRHPGGAASLAATKAGFFADPPEIVRQKLAGVELPGSDREFRQAREAISALIASDRAVFKSHHSFQMANLGLVSSDGTHHRLGTLAACLVCRSNTTKDHFRNAVDRLKTEQANPHWQVQSVLTEPDLVDSWQVDDCSKPDWWALEASCSSFANELEGVLRRCCALVSEAQDTLLPLQVLARTITWVGLITYAQVPTIHSNRAMNKILVEATNPGELEHVRDASNQSLIDIHSAFNRWLAERVRTTLGEEYKFESFDDRQAKEFLRDGWTHPQKWGGRSQDMIKSNLPSVYEEWRKDPSISVSEALSRSLQDALMAAIGEKPKKWFEGVGRNCGFIGPRRGQTPRARVEIPFIPTLILAGLKDDDPEVVPLNTVLARLESRFGIILGPEEGVAVPELDLESNLSAFKDSLTALGLAHRFSDGVTEILNPLKNWVLK